MTQQNNVVFRTKSAWQRMEDGETLEIGGNVRYRLINGVLEHSYPIGTPWVANSSLSQTSFDNYERDHPHMPFITIPDGTTNVTPKRLPRVTESKAEESIKEALYNFRYKD